MKTNSASNNPLSGEPSRRGGSWLCLGGGAVTTSAPFGVMGIVNLTPDSFYDGGTHDSADLGLAHAVRLHAEGADILDLGAESFRPGAQALEPEEELLRLMPVLRELRREVTRLAMLADDSMDGGALAKAAEHLAVPLGVAGVECHALCAVLFLGGVQPLGDFGVSFVPGDGLKLALAPLAHPLERGEDAVFPVEVLAVGQALGAQAAVVGGMAVDALDLDDLAVLDIGIDAAVHTGRADITERMAHLDARVRAGDLRLDLAFQFCHSVASSWSIKDSSRP